jgi:hypothetical protein
VTVTQRHPKEHVVPLRLPQRTQDLLQRFVDCRLLQTSLCRRSIPPVKAPTRWIPTDI